MTFFTTDAPAAGFFSGFAARLVEWRADFAKWRAYRKTVNELSALDNRELADLGLSRASIQSVAHEAVYG